MDLSGIGNWFNEVVQWFFNNPIVTSCLGALILIGLIYVFFWRD